MSPCQMVGFYLCGIQDLNIDVVNPPHSSEAETFHWHFVDGVRTLVEIRISNS
jgi:hypothetical protein